MTWLNFHSDPQTKIGFPCSNFFFPFYCSWRRSLAKILIVFFSSILLHFSDSLLHLYLIFLPLVNLHYKYPDLPFQLSKTLDNDNHYAINIINMMKKMIKTPKILIMSHRLDVTDWKYLRISECAASMFWLASSTLLSILENFVKTSDSSSVIEAKKDIPLNISIKRYFSLKNP